MLHLSAEASSSRLQPPAGENKAIHDNPPAGGRMAPAYRRRHAQIHSHPLILPSPLGCEYRDGPFSSFWSPPSRPHEGPPRSIIDVLSPRLRPAPSRAGGNNHSSTSAVHLSVSFPPSSKANGASRRGIVHDCSPACGIMVPNADAMPCHAYQHHVLLIYTHVRLLEPVFRDRTKVEPRATHACRPD
ncbi:hypothetical protein BT67DRAFT_190905 [Trichocladium antarcticum]|uniref:Uncharacterized protein n=1 Tax=Trichocladium antarcticum TaxID=1450529 RepID=A0AAN6UPH2_9PEZI|nr:hypothetical protein BT67DRAFT_190905 [Trichocladium antarcticum]